MFGGPMPVPEGVELAAYRKNVELADVLRQVDAARDGGARALLLTIDSIGGSSAAACGLFDALRSFGEAGGAVVAYVEKFACSNAAVYMLGADYVVMHPRAVISVHGIVPSPGDAERRAWAWETSMAATAILTRTLAPERDVFSWLEPGSLLEPSGKDLDAREARSFGFADVIGGRLQARELAERLARSPGLDVPSRRRAGLAERGVPASVAELVGALRSYGAEVAALARKET